MSRINFVRNSKENDSKEEDDIIRAIEHTKIEMEVARNIFNSCDDDNLIEMAIYSEEVAKRRFEYLLCLAKERGMIASKEYVLCQCLTACE